MSEPKPESTVDDKSILDILNEDIGPIPAYLMNLLGFLGYNTFATLKDFSVQDLNDVERFAREELLRLLTDTVDERKKYFGPYYNLPKQFRILPGHKKLILSIPSYMKASHEDNASRDNFIGRLKWNSRKILQQTSFKRSIDSLSSAVEEIEEFDQSTSHNPDLPDDDDDEDEDRVSEELNYSSITPNNSSHCDGTVSDAKRIRLGDNNIKTQNDEHRIREAINRWLLNVKHKLRPGTDLSLPLIYSIVFYHRPEEGKMSATIECFMCKIQIGISSHQNKNGSRRWLISNFMRHVKKTHFQMQHQPHGQQQQLQQQLINIVDISTLVKREVE